MACGELVRAVERYARDVAGIDSLKLEAQTRVMPFYAALGYVAEGEDFDVRALAAHRADRAGRRCAAPADAQVAARASTRNVALCCKGSTSDRHKCTEREPSGAGAVDARGLEAQGCVGGGRALQRQIRS